jgi:hypothetical protein
MNAVYIAEGDKLEETIFSALEPNLELWRRVFQDNSHNSVEISEKLHCVHILRNIFKPKLKNQWNLLVHQ